MKLSRSLQSTLVASLIGLVVGALFLLFGAHVEKDWLSILLLNVGAFVIASVAMAVIFEFWQLRSLLDDLFTAARVSEQLQRAQLSGFSVAFHDNVPWEELFNESNRLNLMVAYAATWRNTHQARLRSFLEHQDARLDVVLPDPNVQLTLDELAQRFGIAPDEVRTRIEEAFEFFKELDQAATGTVRVYYCTRTPHFTFYRFNNRVVFATYRHRPGRGPILTFVANRGGEFYDWIRDEWYGITREGSTTGMTRLAYPLGEESP